MNPEAYESGGERTLATSVCVDGVGVHSGCPVQVWLRPAPPGTGIVFCRTDQPGRPLIPAVPESMVSGPRCTTLSHEGATVRTVEHLMAGLLAYGIDNAVVEMDAEEAPILDGSGLPWVTALESAGVVAQEAPRQVCRLEAPVVWSCGETSLVAVPYPVLRISVASVTPHPVAGTQVVDLVVTRAAFCAELAPARTFCYREEVDLLLAAGLARGGSLDNALVVERDGYSSPLRVEQELAAHKALDLLGDLAVLGRSLAMHVVAVRPGHRANQELVHRIRVQQQRWQSRGCHPTESATEGPAQPEPLATAVAES